MRFRICLLIAEPPVSIVSASTARLMATVSSLPSTTITSLIMRLFSSFPRKQACTTSRFYHLSPIYSVLNKTKEEEIFLFFIIIYYKLNSIALEWYCKLEFMRLVQFRFNWTDHVNGAAALPAEIYGRFQ